MNKDLNQYLTSRADGTGLVFKRSVMRAEATKGDSGLHLSGVVSSTRRDVIRDKVMPGALRDWLASWHESGSDPIPMLREHERARVIGTWTSFGIDEAPDGELELRAEGDLMPDLSDVADTSILIDRGILTGLSVGMRVKAVSFNWAENGFDLYGVELKEVSAVLFPANEDAVIDEDKGEDLIRMMKGDELDTEALTDLLCSTDLHEDAVWSMIQAAKFKIAALRTLGD